MIAAIQLAIQIVGLLWLLAAALWPVKDARYDDPDRADYRS